MRCEFKKDHAAIKSGVVKVTFQPMNRTVEVVMEDLPYDDHGKPGSILDVALHYGIDLEHTCGGVCACSTCHVRILSGAEHLSDFDEDREADMLDQARAVTLQSRLGCQAQLRGTGDVVVEIPNWNRNAVHENLHG
jgi:2Fe-2S ferredoxin